jgi:N-acetylglutamate synthase-like GNAT family acetyltransferase
MREEIREETWTPELAQRGDDLIYEFNVAATGISDGRVFAFTTRGEENRLLACALGHTWGGTCELKTLWVEEALRHRGLGRALVLRVIDVAETRGCTQLLLSTHSFQAPDFYARLGFRELLRLNDYPRGHASVFMLRALTPRT